MLPNLIIPRTPRRDKWIISAGSATPCSIWLPNPFGTYADNFEEKMNIMHGFKYSTYYLYSIVHMLKHASFAYITYVHAHIGRDNKFARTSLPPGLSWRRKLTANGAKADGSLYTNTLHTHEYITKPPGNQQLPPWGSERTKRTEIYLLNTLSECMIQLVKNSDAHSVVFQEIDTILLFENIWNSFKKSYYKQI